MTTLQEAWIDFPIIRGYKSKQEKKDEAGKVIKTYHYKYWCFIKPRFYPLHLTPNDVQQAIEDLRGRYPDLDYRCEETEIDGVKYHVIRRKKASSYDPSIYLQFFCEGLACLFSELNRARVFVPKTYAEKRPRKVSTALSYRLAAFKISPLLEYLTPAVKRRLNELYPVEDRDYKNLWKSLELLRLAEKRRAKI